MRQRMIPFNLVALMVLAAVPVFADSSHKTEVKGMIISRT